MTPLLSPQNSPTRVELEMAHVMHWARENKMSLNLLKTVELVFRRPNVSGDLLPPALKDLLAQLKKQGLGIRALDSVFNAIVLNKIL